MPKLNNKLSYIFKPTLMNKNIIGLGAESFLKEGQMKLSRTVIVNGVTFQYWDMLNGHTDKEAPVLLALTMLAHANIDIAGQPIEIEEFDFNSLAIHIKVDGKDYFLKTQ